MYKDMLLASNFSFLLRLPTKCVYIKSTTVYVPSSELGLPTPLSPASVPLPPEPGGGGGTHASRWGVGGVPIPTTGEKA